MTSPWLSPEAADHAADMTLNWRPTDGATLLEPQIDMALTNLFGSWIHGGVVEVDRPLALPPHTYMPYQGPRLHALLARSPAHVRNDAKPATLHVEKSLVRERMALWLVAQGANPWLKDAEGNDALDLAVLMGSRAVVHALLHHPAAPPLSELQARMTSLPGRLVPWTHACAYMGWLGLLDDLTTAGWPMSRTDRMGWTWAAWVNHADIFEKVDQKFPQTMGPPNVLEEAWAKRTSLKLYPSGYDIPRPALLAKLKHLAPQSPEEARNSAWHAEIVTMLNNGNPDRPGKLREWLVSLQNADRAKVVTEWLAQSWTWRHQVTSGNAKGTWSGAAALLWTLVRRGGDATKPHQGGPTPVTKMLSQWASAVQAQPDALAWLDETIRPGVTNRALLWWACAAVPEAKELRAWAEHRPGQPADQARAQMLDEALTMTRTWAKLPGSSWVDRWHEHWHQVCPTVLPRTMGAEDFDTLNGLLELGWAHAEEEGPIRVKHAQQRAIDPAESDDLRRKAAGLLARSLPKKAIRRSWISNNQEAEKVERFSRALREQSWATLRDLASGAPHLLDLPAKFAPFSAEDAKAGLGSPDEVESLLTELALRRDLDPASRRPGSRKVRL